MTVVRAAITALTRAQLPSGGWGWRPDRAANTECTALASWALHAHDGAAPDRDAVARGLAWLRSRQQPDGSWPVSEQVPGGSWMTSLAVLALARIAVTDPHAVRGGAWLLAQRSGALPRLQRLALRVLSRNRGVTQDADLVAWSWTAGATAWVEPTSWALLALKQLYPPVPHTPAAERIRLAHAMLRDRMCVGGGWNYGNRIVNDSELQPYPDTTALALSALQDEPASAVTGVSRTRLRGLLAQQRSTLALALAVLSLQLFGEDVSPLRAQLVARLHDGRAAADVRTLALALLALDERTAQFRVGADA